MGFSTEEYFEKHTSNSSALPNIGIATSGGGWRALMSGAGVIEAFDSRTSKSKLGGLLQSATYLAGLSGGGWLVSTSRGITGTRFLYSFLNSFVALRYQLVGNENLLRYAYCH